MNFTNVKDLSVPVNGTDKGVYKIKNANGDVLWASYTKYPYRRLGFILFTGSEYIDLGFKPGSTGNQGVQKLTALIQGPTASGTYGVLLGCAGDSTSSGSMRILVQTSADQMGHRVGRNSSTFGHSAQFSSSDYYIFRLRTTSNSSTYVDIQDADGNLITGTNANTSATYTVNNMPNECIMGYNSGGSIVSNGYITGSVKRFQQHASDGASALIKDMYPCQRRSDGKLGLFDVINQIFYPMQGTNTTHQVAVEILEDYWDGSDPNA